MSIHQGQPSTQFPTHWRECHTFNLPPRKCKLRDYYYHHYYLLQNQTIFAFLAFFAFFVVFFCVFFACHILRWLARASPPTTHTGGGGPPHGGGGQAGGGGAGADCGSQGVAFTGGHLQPPFGGSHQPPTWPKAHNSAFQGGGIDDCKLYTISRYFSQKISRYFPAISPRFYRNFYAGLRYFPPCEFRGGGGTGQRRRGGDSDRAGGGVHRGEGGDQDGGGPCRGQPTAG